MVQGYFPYKQIFLIVPLGYLWFLAPIFLFGGGGTFPFFASRVLSFCVFIALAITMTSLFWQMRKSFLAPVVALFLIFLPLPSDKFIEVRPDTLAVLFAMLGVVFHIQWMDRYDEKRKRSSFFLAGLMYGTSLVVMQKTLPQVALASLFAVGFTVAHHWRKPQFFKASICSLVPFVIGLFFVSLIFLAAALGYADLSTIWYHLIQLPQEGNKMAQYFAMNPGQFFNPIDVYYGQFGWHLGYFLNLVLWFIGIGMGIIRLVTPYIPHGKKGVWQELFLASMFLMNIVLFVFFIPLKHTQYLIPIAGFVAWYMTDTLYLLWNKLKETYTGQFVFCAVFILFLAAIYRGNALVHNSKMWWSNEITYRQLSQTLSVIPATEYVFDLEGLTLYYPYPYYVCCLPFGQGAQFYTRKLPPLSRALEETQTKFIYQGTSKRVTTLLPEDQEYIKLHFTITSDELWYIRNEAAGQYKNKL